jgi:NAD(P)-dependent dehydrogenase (short-subunit alcohol dehydrogenase family)
MSAAGATAFGLARRAMRRDAREFFADRGVVVTGGASGIGLALVERLREHGARVVVVDVDAEALERLQNDVPGVPAIRLDLASEDGPRAMLERSIEVLGRVDVVFSNAGIVWAAPFLLMSDADVRRLIDVNFTMQVRLTRELLPYFVDHGGGVIAYTGSLSSYVYSPMHSVYTGTKGGLNGFVNAVRRELPAYSGVQLSTIHPNITRTDLVAPELLDEVRRRTRHLQSPLQVADAFLQGVADGRREILVEVTDHLFVAAERYAPAALDWLFRTAMDEEIMAKAEAAIGDSKLRRQIAGLTST